MSFTDRLGQDIKAAMLARDADRLGALRLLKSALGYAQIERKNENLSDAEIISIVQKEVKKRRDAIEQFEKGGRPEQAAKEKAEMTVLEGYLPTPLTPEELEQLVRAAIQETGATSKKDMGVVMKAAQAKAAGRADGKTISTLVGKLLP
ncbi:MAG: GatB/YqeY domain-containing protein [Verrucomicrobia bacterium]|nr:GatB/YqeY domain-containing protein [Verrucomicrobiota bacterium]